MSKDTKSRIFAAADEISAAGQNPTFAAILLKKILRTGSNMTVILLNLSL